MSTYPPLQFAQLARTSKIDGVNYDMLFGAAGSRIYSFNTQNGQFLTSWSTKDHAKLNETADMQNGSPSTNFMNGEHPEKKRRLSSPHAKSESSSAEILLERPKGKGVESGKSALPTVIKLAVTRDNSRLIAVTAEDKCLRVLKIDSKGQLSQESQRSMPKRPCSIALTPDENIILCGDKFGDVYSLPMQVSQSSEIKTRPSETETTKAFKPSASELTVHTKGNRLTLQNQLRTAQQAKEKPPLAFEKKLILGHVSLLTDLKYISLPAELSPSGRERHYLLTSDRDEHIRVSRGLPQSHITETYCLGHTEFVNKLCVPDWQRDLLISGGGDSFLLVWRWAQGRLLQKVDLSQPVFNLLHEQNLNSQTSSAAHLSEEVEIPEPLSATSDTVSGAESRPIAVTGIWSMKRRHKDRSNMSGNIFVACEGIAAVFCYQIDEVGDMAYQQTIRLDGNALDLLIFDSRQTITVSVDLVHEPNSTKLVRNVNQVQPGRVISTYAFDRRDSTWKAIMENDFETVNQCEYVVTCNESPTTSLYATESLRKRVQDDME